MKVGTKSVLFGAHCFLIHPWFVALAWWKLYGFPSDPRLWVAFFVHDLGYIGKPNMDGPEGEEHVRLGAVIMYMLFGPEWCEFALYHSRYYAKKHGRPFSRLCVADKLAFALTPDWLYLPMVRASGELAEYLQRANRAETSHWEPCGFDAAVWHARLCVYLREWVAAHQGGNADTWTNAQRNAEGTL